MKLGEILNSQFGISQRDIERALEIQRQVQQPLGQILISEGVISENQLLEALSIQLDLPLFNENELLHINDLPYEILTSLDLDFLIRLKFIPISFVKEKNYVLFITNDPLNSAAISYIQQRIPYKIEIMLANESQISEYAKIYIKSSDYQTLNIDDSIEKLKELAFEAPVIKYLNQILNKAVEVKATDIHIEPKGNTYRVRFRIDGILHEIDNINKELYLAVVSRIKLLAGLDIAEKRLPQDGKIALRLASINLDIRVSTIPMFDGESVVLRLLYKERLHFDITKLGMEPDHEVIIRELIKSPYGMILITGPTGSGKTTTLYSILTNLNSMERKIITVEDPVEYQLEGINQIQVKSDIGLSFAKALRSILRHDPDIIMIGEIRDRETAEIAIHSALTGHLVLSTLHTNDAPSALFRLIEMGLEDYLLNASIIGLVAQRIIRKICPHCSTPMEPSTIFSMYPDSEIVLERFSYLFKNSEIYPRYAHGCAKCLNTGYLGRMAIFELFSYNDHLKEIFTKHKSLEIFKRELKDKYNFRTLREDGFVKVFKGITTPEEILRVS